MACRLEDLGLDGLGGVCRHLELRTIVKLSCASQSLNRLFQEQGAQLASQCEARLSLRCSAITSSALAGSLAQRMLAWRVRRLRIALLTGPAAELLAQVAPVLEHLAVAPEGRAQPGRNQHKAGSQLGESGSGSDSDSGGEEESEEDEEEEGGGPGWEQGRGPVGTLAGLLPPGLLSLRAGCLVQCPFVALAGCTALRHLTLDASSGNTQQFVEPVRSLPPALASLTVTSGGSPLADITARVFQLGPLLQHAACQRQRGPPFRLTVRMDTPSSPAYAELLLDGSAQQLWELAALAELELRLADPRQACMLVLMPKMRQRGLDFPGGHYYGSTCDYCISNWAMGRFVGCKLVPAEGPEGPEGLGEGSGGSGGGGSSSGGALARPVRVRLPGGRVAWWQGELEGRGASESELEDNLSFSSSEELDLNFFSEDEGEGQDSSSSEDEEQGYASSSSESEQEGGGGGGVGHGSGSGAAEGLDLKGLKL